LGKTRALTDQRRIFVLQEEILRELETLPPVPIDYITLSGAGEPTLAKNLGKMIKGIRKSRSEKVAVITNSSLLGRCDVRDDLSDADFVLAKLDACGADSFRKINRPMRGIHFRTVVRALKDFRGFYRGRLALQMMFVSINEKHAERMAELAAEIRPDEIQLNTPLRPCRVPALSEAALRKIEICFRRKLGPSLPILNVFRGQKKKVSAISAEDTLRRRGKFLKNSMMSK
jgi:wyosine [tRNA(Phe)-imidazoG37] synthetase (radical SAM superfamily)